MSLQARTFSVLELTTTPLGRESAPPILSEGYSRALPTIRVAASG